MIKVGSLFSGIGGIDLGFEQEGFEIVWANDIDAEACKTYRHNFPNTQLIEDDVRDIDPRTLPDIDVLVAGFPCQPFSIMGYRRRFKDPRGNLFFEISRFIDIKRPRIVFLENVRNLMEHDDGKTFLVFYNTLAQFGYSVKYQVINATDVNLPQNRARIFIVAFLNIEDCDPGYDRAEVIEVLTNAVDGRYLAYLCEIGIPYVIAGDDTIDVELALSKISEHLAPKFYLLEGGSIVNGHFLCADCVDEL